MTQKRLETNAPSWVESLGGDGLHSRTITWHSAEHSEGIKGVLSGLKSGFFWRELEQYILECEVIINSHGWTKLESEGWLSPDGCNEGWPGDGSAAPFSDLWYAGRVASLCWIVLNSRVGNDGLAEVNLSRIMLIGTIIRDWYWRSAFKKPILAKIDHDTQNRENAKKGGNKSAERAQVARATLASHALRPGTIEQWIGQSPARQVTFLRRLATSIDNAMSDEEKLFHVSDGGLRTPLWFKQRISDWQSDGSLTRAIKSLT